MVGPESTAPRKVGRYALFGEIAVGGMATVHYGRLLGPVGFARTVAIKRLHPQFAKDPEFVSMFLDEARLAARIHHPNVVQTLDVVALDGELFLVMDYVQGESLGRLLRALRQSGEPMPLTIVSAIFCGALHGLHAAHDATGEHGEPLRIVHRDVSPQNVLVGADGVPRVLDFGVAKAVGRTATTREGRIKGKLAYMAPEQLRGGSVDRRTDVYAAGVVLWETLTRQRLFAGDNEGAIVTSVLDRPVEPPGKLAADVPKALDELTMRALERDPDKRFPSARDMALSLESIVPIASAPRLSEWVANLAGEALARRARTVAEIESSSTATRATAQEPPTEGGASQVSSVSMSTSSVRERVGPLTRRAWIVYGALAGAAAWLFLSLVSGGHRGDRSAEAPAAPTLAAAPPPPAAPLPTLPSPGASDVSPPPPSVAPPVLPPPHVSTTARPASTRGAPSRRSPPSRTPSASAPCALRTYVDDAGIKHYVRECK